MFAREGIVTMKVVNISLRDSACLTSLKTLPILNDLITVVVAPTLNPVIYPINIPERPPMTINKSKLFHPSSKYFLP
jgi:hypothetical protein